VVFNDKSYGNVERDMKKIFKGKTLGTKLKNPDFIKLANSYGVVGIKAKTPDALKESLKKAISLNKPVLIEVPIGQMPSPF
jgi:acetolactate synthase-1/2/3 large subunit